MLVKRVDCCVATMMIIFCRESCCFFPGEEEVGGLWSYSQSCPSGFQVAELEQQSGHSASCENRTEDLFRSVEDMEALLKAKDEVRAFFILVHFLFLLCSSLSVFNSKCERISVFTGYKITAHILVISVVWILQSNFATEQLCCSGDNLVEFITSVKEVMLCFGVVSFKQDCTRPTKPISMKFGIRV